MDVFLCVISHKRYARVSADMKRHFEPFSFIHFLLYLRHLKKQHLLIIAVELATSSQLNANGLSFSSFKLKSKLSLQVT